MEQYIKNNLPEGWDSTSIKMLATLRKGKKPNKVDKVPWSGAVPYIDIEAFENGNIRRYADPKSSTLVNEGEIIIVWDGARCGHTGKVPKSGALGSTLGIMEPISINPDYILRFLQLSFDTINTNPRGIGIPHVEPELFWNLEVPLAPLLEQKRIVAKVEELLVKVNLTKERLTKVSTILKRFRQAVLAAACSGRLTADWREGNGKNESALELLKQIQKERQESGGEKGSSHHTLVKGVSQTNSDLPTLPDSWVRLPLSELLHYTRSASYGVLQPGADLPDGVPMVRVCDIQNGTILMDQLKKISKGIDAQYVRTRLQGGEVLVTLVGTIGRTAVVPEEAVGANVARAVAMLPFCQHVLPKFIHYALSEPFKNAELVELAREVARKTLNLGLLKAVQVPLAPVKEQKEIVLRVESMFKLAGVVEKRVAVAKARAEKLTQSILAKAFRGELVPTEAELARREGHSYESASELLARIKSERESIKVPTPDHRRRVYKR